DSECPCNKYLRPAPAPLTRDPPPCHCNRPKRFWFCPVAHLRHCPTATRCGLPCWSTTKSRPTRNGAYSQVAPPPTWTPVPRRAYSCARECPALPCESETFRRRKTCPAHQS